MESKVLTWTYYCDLLLYMNIKRSKLEWESIYDEYLAGATVKELGTKYGVNRQSIYDGFIRNGLSCNVGFVNKNADIDYFKQLRTPTEAYAFGLWLTDGHTAKDGWYITLQKQDAAVLESIAGAFYKKPHPLGYHGNVCRFRGYAAPVVQRLRELFRENKTETLRLVTPPCPDSLMPAVIRGIFDGDGCITVNKRRPNNMPVNIYSISEPFLLDIKAYLAAQGVDTFITVDRRKGKPMHINGNGFVANHDMYRLNIAGMLDSARFFELLYTRDDGPKLLRKYNRYKEHYDNIVQLLVLKGPALSVYDVHDFYAQHTAGRSIRDIGCQLNLSSSDIALWFRRNKLEVRSRVTRRG